MFTTRGCANPLVWLSNEPAGGWLFILGLLVYLAVSTWSVGYEFACESSPSRRRRRGDPAASPTLLCSSRLEFVNNTSISSFFLGLLHFLASLPPPLPLSAFIPSPFVPSSSRPNFLSSHLLLVPSSLVQSFSSLPSLVCLLRVHITPADSPPIDMQLWGVACGGKTWTRPAGPSTGEKVSAVGVWVGLGLVRTWFLLCWAFAVVRSYAPRSNSRLCGRTTVHQSDFLIWGHLPDRYSNDAMRFRFCRVGCRARDEPLADRVYHCSYIGTLHAKGKREDASVHLALYDHFCGWLRVCV